MKKKLNWLAALLFNTVYSCSDESANLGVQNENMVDFTMKTSIPVGMQTYTSEEGGISNVDPGLYDLRYILEVWTKETPRRLAYRDTKIVKDNFKSSNVTFTARLLALEYDFVFWADFVTEGTSSDLFYKTNNGATEEQIMNDPANADPGLTAIEMIGGYDISSEARDAYYKKQSINLSLENITNGTIYLERPFGKYRLIALDAIDGYLKDVATTATVEYVNGNTFPAGFNALTGEVNTNITIDVSGILTSTAIPETVKDLNGNIISESAFVLASDYIFAPPARTVSFTTKTYSDNAASIQIGQREISNIPIVENKLTTIIGNFFSNEGQLSVIVSDPFDTGIVIPCDIIIINNDPTKVYPTIQAALAASKPGDVINVPSGTFDLGKGITIPAERTLQGAGKDQTILKTQQTTDGQISVSIADGGVLDGVWVMYNPDRIPGTAWNSENPTGVNLRSMATLKNSRVTGHRNGVYANNVSGFIVENNEMWGNRTGFQLANGAHGAVNNNSFKNNETIGLLLLPMNKLLNEVPNFKDNSFEGNWSSDFENRWDEPYVVDLNGNTFSDGTKTMTIAPDSGEGSSSASFSKEDVTFKSNIVSAIESNINLSGVDVIQ